MAECYSYNCKDCGQPVAHHGRHCEGKHCRTKSVSPMPCGCERRSATSIWQQEAGVRTSESADTQGDSSSEGVRSRPRRQHKGQELGDDRVRSTPGTSHGSREAPHSQVGKIRRQTDSRSRMPPLEAVFSARYNLEKGSNRPGTTSRSSSSGLHHPPAAQLIIIRTSKPAVGQETIMLPATTSYLSTCLTNSERITNIDHPDNQNPVQLPELPVKFENFPVIGPPESAMPAITYPASDGEWSKHYKIKSGRYHPMRTALLQNSYFEPDEWTLWRTNPPSKTFGPAAKGYEASRNGRYNHARETCPAWPYPLPYEPLEVFIDRQKVHVLRRSSLSHEEEGCMMRQYWWREEHDKPLRFPDTVRNNAEIYDKTSNLRK